MSKHSRTPWWQDAIAKVVNADGVVIGSLFDFNVPNAEFIVLAVNAHADLVAALQGVLRVAGPDAVVGRLEPAVIDPVIAALKKAGAL